MPQSADLKPSVATQAVSVPFMQSFRNPSTFSGQNGQDPIKWLKEYERVSKFNQWDDMMQLANVCFYLTGTAQLWFENNEDQLNSWTKFETELKRVFGDNQRHARQAEEMLKCRAQRQGEDTQAYIQSVLQLCRNVNPNMSEEDKVGHLMKGIAEDFYQALLLKDIKTADEFIKWVQYMEMMRQKRVSTNKRFQRLPNVVPVASLEEPHDIVALIRQIVREELQKLTTPEINSPEPQIHSLEDIIREEVEQALAPISTRTSTTSSVQAPRRPTYAQAARRQPPVVQPQRRKTDIWRTDDNQPICFHCGRPGHVLRYCRERRAIFDAYRSSRRNPVEVRGYQTYDDDSYERIADRSPSPRRPSVRGRSPTRRTRSPSPYRSSSRSPSRRNEEN